MGQLTGEVVVVTGGGSGIGRAVCELAAARGAAVGVLDLDGDAAQATRAALPGGEHASHAVDVSDQAAVNGWRFWRLPDGTELSDLRPEV